jgi:hypothetical protein
MGWWRHHRIAARTAMALCAGAVVAPVPARAELARPSPRAFAPAIVERVHAHVSGRLADLEPATRAEIARTIVAEARTAGLDPLVVIAVIQVESSFDPEAISPAGALGLMQLREPTLRAELLRHGVESADPRDPVANVQAGVRYLARLVAAFGSFDLALMAYNAGPARILGHLRAGGIPERFRVYPARVRVEVERLRRLYGLERPAASGRAPLASHRVRRGAWSPAALAAHRPPMAPRLLRAVPCCTHEPAAARVAIVVPADGAPAPARRPRPQAMNHRRARRGRRIASRRAARAIAAPAAA